MRPLVAVTTSITPATDGRPERANLNSTYLNAIQAAGGVPILVTPQFNEPTVAEVMHQVSGLVLTGGGDVYPALYGEAPHENTVGVSIPRDRTEIEALRFALERRLPVLAICRGMQLLNVALGGSLYQDLPSQCPSDISHSQTGSGAHTRDETTHAVRVETASCLAAVFGASELATNSMHHQALKALGEGIRAVAWAPDGVVEGVEMPAERWVLGVQWHPEELFAAHHHARRLFEAFVAACGPAA
jgi:putative glutamine amidotransferase